MGPPENRGITRTRDRLTCVECRRRKLRCDRNSPCASCVRRGDAGSCTYQRFTNGTNGTGANHDGVEKRLDHLEGLIKQYIAHNGPKKPSPDPSEQTSSGQQSIDVGIDEQQPRLVTSDTMFGPTHWSSMLEDIQALRFSIADGVEIQPLPQEQKDEAPDQGIGIIFGSTSRMALKDILDQYLPPRREVDRLISSYVKARAFMACTIHMPQFRRQYQAFWVDPLNTSPLWVSILFSMCHVVKNAMGSKTASEDCEARNNNFSIAAAHCLVAGEYFRPKRFAVESLLLYAQSLCLTSEALPPDIVPALGIMSRTAYMMGYHRDPNTLGLSPFEIEMRRRTLSLLIQFDMIVCFYLGMPSTTQCLLSVAAAQPPLNIHDSDFDEDSTEMPPPRKDTEPTGIQFYNAKHMFIVVFDKILRHVLGPYQGDDTSQVDALDAEMREILEDLPEFLKPRPISDSIFDPFSVVVTRMCVQFLYCKCRCVLHRPQVLRHRPESIRACYEASSTLLTCFSDFYYQFSMNGQGEWFISSLSWHDFLLGAVSLCLVTLVGLESSSAHLIDIQRSVRLLSKVKDIWGTQLRKGVEKQRVLSIINATLGRLQDIKPRNPFMPADNAQPTLTSFPREDDSLWDEYLGQYLNLDLPSDEIMFGVMSEPNSQRG